MLAALEWVLREWNLRSLPTVTDAKEDQELIQSLAAQWSAAEFDLLPMRSPEKSAQIQFEITVSDFVNSKGILVNSPAFCLARSDFDAPEEKPIQRLHLNPRHELYSIFQTLDKAQQLDLCQLCFALNQWPMAKIDYPECLEFHWGVRVLGGPIQLYSKAISEKMWVQTSPLRPRPTLVLFPKNHGDEFSQTHLHRWSERDKAVLAELKNVNTVEEADPQKLGGKLLYYSPLLLLHLKRRSMHDLVTEDKWYGLSAFFSNTVIDRTETLKQSLKLHVLDPIPKKDDLAHFDSDLKTVMIERASELLTQAEEEDKDIEVFWSGGIDSTAIIAALVMAATPKQLKRVVARLDDQSIDEHPAFYRHIIKKELRIEELDGLSISREMKQNRLSVTGECGDQIFGSATMKKCFAIPSYVRELGLPNRFAAGLKARWQDTALATMLDKKIVTKRDEWLEWFEPQLKQSPLPIVSTFDFLWWLNFSLKWQTVSLRCFNNSWDQLENQSEPGLDPLKGIHHFFRGYSFQLWSCKAENHARKFADLTDWKSYKEPLKRFIFDFDKNENYYKYKEKVGSLKRDTELPMGCPLMGIDDRHNAIYWGRHSLWNSRYHKKYGRSLERFLT